MEIIENMGWEVPLHPPYNPDLAPSDYQVFGFVNNQTRGQYYETNEALQTAVRPVFGQVERISTARDYSDFQNDWKKLYRETGIM
jgi:hypothetical protein